MQEMMVDSDVRAKWEREDAVLLIQYKLGLFWTDLDVKPQTLPRLKMVVDAAVAWGIKRIQEGEKFEGQEEFVQGMKELGDAPSAGSSSEGAKG